MGIKERICYFLVYKGISVTRAEKELGWSKSSLLKSNNLSGDKIEEFVHLYSDVDCNWLITGQGEMLKSNQPSAPMLEIKTKPRVPITAAAGSLSGDTASVTLRECEQLPVILQLPSYDYTIIIKGDSMMPKYESGDELACRRIDHTRFIQWGKTHVLDTSQGIVVKKIYEEGDCIKCVSINPAYPPFLVPKEDVYSLSLVVGSVNITEI